MKVTILGSGAYGLSLALMFNENNCDITIWTKFEEEQQEISNNTEFSENINNQILNLSKDKIKELILNKLKEAQIFPEKVEIFMDINTHNCIEIIRAKIYINKKYEFLIPKIKSEVDNNFKIFTEIIVI